MPEGGVGERVGTRGRESLTHGARWRCGGQAVVHKKKTLQWMR